ncbi:MAG: GWxTD domain-containing protein, partial [Syntrophothermus sp.]
MSKLKYFFISLFIFTGVLSGQHQNGRPGRPQFQDSNGFMFEVISLPSEKGFNCFLTFRVEYKKLVFVKTDNDFKAKFSLSIEATDSLTGRIFRESTDQEVVAPDYEMTNSPAEYAQGLIKLTLGKGKFSILPSVHDLNTGIEHNFRRIELDLMKPVKDIILDPVVATIKNDQMTLANFEGAIPFSRKSYDLIIPVSDTMQNSLQVELFSEDSLVLKTDLKESFISGLDFRMDNSSVTVVKENNTIPTRNFIVRDVNKSLREGGSRIKVSYGSKPEENRTFVKWVRWTGKPISLMNAEFAVKMLKYIASENDIDQIKNSSGSQLMPAIWKFWKKFDPTPETAFNELMEEYYQRVDYALNNFSIVAAHNGAETDRGRIYIKYGKPLAVERSYNNTKEVVEVWNYSNPERK